MSLEDYGDIDGRQRTFSDERLFQCACMVMNNAPAIRESTKYEREYPSNVTNRPFKLPMSEDKGGIGTQVSDFET